MDERKKDHDTFLSEKPGGKTKQDYHNDICTWKRIFFPVKLKLQEESVE